MLIILAVATFVEKAKGASFVASTVYGSWWFIVIWFIIAVGTLIYVLQERMYKRPMVFLLHVAFFVILFGAFLTFSTSVQGKIHLREGIPENTFIDKNKRTHQLPFGIVLSKFEIDYYPGTQAPYNYVSRIQITSNGKQTEGQVSMNKIFSSNGYRFYQSSYDRDMQGSTLLVKSDRYGLPVTYLGYVLLLIGMIGYFFSKGTNFRKLLNHPSLKRSTVIALFALASITTTFAGTNTVSKESAKQLGEIQMLYRDRICPVQTFAKDFTMKLYGKSSYKSLLPEQVLAGWIFYSSSWKDEPVIKVKNKAVQQILGINSQYASFSDFFVDEKSYKLEIYLQKIHLGEKMEGAKDIVAADEKIQLLFMLRMETLLKMFPQKGEGGDLIWYSPADELPETVPENEQLLIRGSFSLLKEYALANDWDSFKLLLNKLNVFQQKSGGNFLLSSRKISAERLYNAFNVIKPITFVNLFIGLFTLVYFFRRENKKDNVRKKDKILPVVFPVFLIANGLAILFLICLRAYISGRIPLGNGFETLQFLAVCIMSFALIFRKRIFVAIPFGFLFSGLVLLVSMMGASNPQITQLQPVLISPLLSIHVSLIMIAYTLLGFITFISIVSFLIIIAHKSSKVDFQKSIELINRLLQLSVFSRILLYPAVFLLAGGIFVGAVWAEVSWGSYWSWDPKETWALITLLIYVFPLHEKILFRLQHPFFFHVYCLIAFLSVLMTYFGVNYVLGGMHSYGADTGLNIMLVILLLLLFCVVLPLWSWMKYRKISSNVTL